MYSIFLCYSSKRVALQNNYGYLLFTLDLDSTALLSRGLQGRYWYQNRLEMTF